MVPNKKHHKSFAQSLMMMEICGNDESLREYLKSGQDLNEPDPSSGVYPLQDMISSRCCSSLVSKALIMGARPDLPSKNGDTLLHTIIKYPKLCLKRELSYSPIKNVLSALALPTYQYHDDPVPEKNLTLEELHDKKLRSTASVIKTFLLCLKRRELEKLIPDVTFHILAHLVDDTCSPILFSLTLPYMRYQEYLIERFPFSFFACAAQSRTNAAQEQFLAFYAPLFARYRLNRAQKVLERVNNEGQTVHEAACAIIPMLQDVGYTGWQITEATKMAHLLNPDGFEERHLDNCTKIIRNALLDRELFYAFPEFFDQEQSHIDNCTKIIGNTLLDREPFNEFPDFFNQE